MKVLVWKLCTESDQWPCDGVLHSEAERVQFSCKLRCFVDVIAAELEADRVEREGSDGLCGCVREFTWSELAL